MFDPLRNTEDDATRSKITHMSQSRLCTMVVLLMMGGCAGSMGTIHSNPPPPPVTSFDGSYRSTIHTHPFIGQMNTWCATPGQPIITVENGQFTYAVPHPNLPSDLSRAYSATFAQDGSFIGEDAIGTLSGRVDGTHIEGKIDGSGCDYALTGDRI